MVYGSGRSGGFGRSGGGFNRGGGGFRRDFGPREMHKIKCSECGKDAEVPFKPRNDTPVYCRECFFKKKGMTPRNNEDRPSKPKDKESEEDLDEESEGEEEATETEEDF
jgi:CxxC-x17-CxxC domain-containing protein